MFCTKREPSDGSRAFYALPGIRALCQVLVLWTLVTLLSGTLRRAGATNAADTQWPNDANCFSKEKLYCPEQKLILQSEWAHSSGPDMSSSISVFACEKYFWQLVRGPGAGRKIEGKRRRGRQRMRWLDSITDLINMNLGNWEIMRDREAWRSAVHGVAELNTTEQQHETNISACHNACICLFPCIDFQFNLEWTHDSKSSFFPHFLIWEFVWTTGLQDTQPRMPSAQLEEELDLGRV